jgi:hypothetical protein
MLFCNLDFFASCKLRRSAIVLQLTSQLQFGDPTPLAPPQPRVRTLNHNQVQMLHVDVQRFIA